LDLPVDAIVDELVASICQSLALVPVSDIKPDYIGVVGKDLVCHPMEIMLGLPVNTCIDVPYFRAQPAPLL
jgi:hypothetical protein